MNSNFSTQKNLKSKIVFNEFKNCIQLQYNGRLTIQSHQGKAWNFYYRLGQLVWATGGNHPHRRLRRNIAYSCPHLDIKKINLGDTSIDYWDYCCLEDLGKNNQVSKIQINDIVMNIISEVLFDLVQEINLSSLTCTYEPAAPILDLTMISTSTNMFLQQVQISWNNWANAGLANISPDLAPVLKQPEALRRYVSPSVFNKLAQLINGKHTLSDLAVEMKQSVLQITQSLLPFIRKGIAELVLVPDSPLINSSRDRDSIGRIYKQSPIPLIACVDDSPQICGIMEQIITAQGMKFIGIQNSAAALPILLENKPDLIFLDLIMPSVNGFELCAHLRRVSLFSNTPIVILTGSDGIFDQVKSKVFGATDFITKPITQNKAIAVIDKYLKINLKAEIVGNTLASCH
jgi:chemotaxis family two-component system response regulator PixG